MKNTQRHYVKSLIVKKSKLPWPRKTIITYEQGESEVTLIV